MRLLLVQKASPATTTCYFPLALVLPASDPDSVDDVVDCGISSSGQSKYFVVYKGLYLQAVAFFNNFPELDANAMISMEKVKVLGLTLA